MVVRSRTQLPPWRTGLGAVLAVLAILAGLVWFVLVSQALLNLLPPHQLTLARAEKSVVLAVLLMAGAAVALRDWSMIWQVSLQSTAAGSLVAGVNLLVVPLFYNWHALFGDVGLLGIMSLILALTSAALMRHWQSKAKGHARASHTGPVPTKSEPGTLAAVVEEIKAGSFFTNTRHRSSRRKSAWNLQLPIIIVPLWLLLWWAAVEIVWLVHVAVTHAHISGATESWMKGMGSAMSLAGFLMIFPLLIPTMIGAMVLGNFAIYLIPAARAYVRWLHSVDRGTVAASHAGERWRYSLLGALAVTALMVAVPIAFFESSRLGRINVALFVVRYVMSFTAVFVVLVTAASLLLARRIRDA